MSKSIILMILLAGASCRAEVRINEVMASNVRSFPNAMDFEDYPDWLELSNSSGAEVSLFGYYLSDDPQDLRKWAFPSTSVIQGGEQLVVVADGYDRGPGSLEERDYVGGLDFVTTFHHTNFALSSSGETLSLSRESHSLAPLVPLGSTWNYLASDAFVASTWNSQSYDDSAWASGEGPFGYDAPFYGDLETEVDYGPSKSDKHITTYFRRKFTIPEGVGYFPVTFYCEVNDGAVVYLNGVEVLRHNLPAGPIVSETLASAELSPFAQVDQVEVPVDLVFDNLQEGENIIAVEVHQAGPSSDDLFFDFSYLVQVIDFFNSQPIGTDFDGKEWSYLDDGSSQPATWKELSYDDSGWATGESAHGYFARETPQDPSLTQIPFGGDPGDKWPRTYFRKQFMVEDTSAARGLRLTYQIDDAATFYLNGEEIFQDDATPEDPLEVPFRTVTLPSDSLVSGLNTLAVRVDQNSPTSPSMRFESSLEMLEAGELELVDQITFGDQVDDVSLGRDAIDPERWVFSGSPSPGAANGGVVVTELREVGPGVEFSPSAGLYAASQMVTMTTAAGEIRYTTDGTNPSFDSALYTDPFEVSATTVIRARVFDSGKVPGEIGTSTYFIGETFANGLPVVSLTAPPETLFGSEIGIYGHAAERGGNIHKGVDAPGNLEFFPPDGSKGFSVNGGFRLGGENNFLAHAQKAFNFATRGKYGDDAINYDLFPGSGVGTFTGLTLREGGDDWGKAHLTDAIWDTMVKGRMETETNRYRPVAMFVNGVYWGLYNLRDRWNDNWFYQEYGTDDGDYDHIGVGSDVKNGTLDEWSELSAYLARGSGADPDFWEVVSSEIDIDSLIDYAVCETYGRNSSWRGNREWWKDQRKGGKWRWFIPDMDRSFENSTTRPNMSDFLRGDTTIAALRSVREFRDRFLQRAAAHLADTLSESRVRGIITELGAAAAPEIPKQLDRWGTPSVGGYEFSLGRMRNFASARQAGYLFELGNELGNANLIDLALAVEGEGSFRMAGVRLAPQTLEAFSGNEFELEALPAPGYRFDHWTGAEGGVVTTVSLAESSQITAHFVADNSTALVGELTEDTTLTVANSPYVITGDLIVPSGVTLTIEEGVGLELDVNSHLRVMGTLVVVGTEVNPVTFSGRHGETWGGISFEEPVTQSTLAHVVIRGASRGKDPVSYPAAISGLNADVVMDFIDLTSMRGPLFFRGGSMVLRDSLIAIPLTGDGLNVKGGSAQTIRCTFIGNDSPDTDAIDYDGVVDGVIRDCRIYDFRGFNSDGIDLGENCVNCLIEGNTIFFTSDKGVSVGQSSSVILRRNLIVGCPIGVAIKDEGSVATIDQNTIVDCAEGVAVFEKNFGNGGGGASVTNTIFSGCVEPVTGDVYSSLTVAFSLSDTVALPGGDNLLGDPQFVDAVSLNFELVAASPAIDAGDPQHEADPDGSRVDIGAAYQFSPDDYPFDSTPTVVVNELLANSGDAPDWTELHNRTAEDINIGGWFLSDDRSELSKYRIPADTVIGAGAFLTFSEDLHFGSESADPGRLVGFALSETGETVYLTSAVGDQLTNYRFEEDFGPSLEGSTIGFYDKTGNGSYDFVSLASATPGAVNALPLVGPVVITEIMYHAEVEFIEILNVSNGSVDLSGWIINDGVEFVFLNSSLQILQPGERGVFTNDLAAFMATYQPENTLKVWQWTDGKLSNSGERVQLSRPGPLNDLGSRTYVRVDRVNYDDDAPWDTDADGTGLSLTRIDENLYGNDFANWEALAPTPGLATPSGGYEEWATLWGISDPDGDADGDGLSNLFEYAFDRNPQVAGESELLAFTREAPSTVVTFPLGAQRSDLEIVMEKSNDLQSWTVVSTEILNGVRQAMIAGGPVEFYRLRIVSFE